MPVRVLADCGSLALIQGMVQLTMFEPPLDDIELVRDLCAFFRSVQIDMQLANVFTKKISERSTELKAQEKDPAEKVEDFFRPHQRRENHDKGIRDL